MTTPCTGNGGSDTYTGGETDSLDFRVSSGTSVAIADYTRGATMDDSETIRLYNASGNNPTHADADSGTNLVLTVTKVGSMVSTITLQGLTSSSTNFANLKTIIVDGSARVCS